MALRAGLAEREVYFVPLTALCRLCGEDRESCGLWSPRMARDDVLPREACEGFAEAEEGEEDWETDEERE